MGQAVYKAHELCNIIFFNITSQICLKEGRLCLERNIFKSMLMSKKKD